MQVSNVSKYKFTAIMLFTAVLTGGIAACSKQESVESLVSDAKQYQKKGEDKAAIIQLKNALQKSPDHVEARVVLAKIYNDVGDYQSAEKEIRKASSLGADPVRSLSILGAALLMQGKPQNVLDELNSLEEAKADAEILTLRGHAYLAQGKRPEAKQAFERALKVTADYPNALIGLAKSALTERDVEAAARFAERAVATSPENADVWFFKGDLSRAQGKLEPAIAAYDKVLALKPGNPNAHLVKADVEIGAKKFDAARADIEAAKKSSFNGLMVLYTQAYLDHSQGRHSAALESLQQVLRAAPEHMPSILLAGSVQLALGATQQAEQHLRKYLEKYPNNLQANKMLVASLLKNGQAERAQNIIETALKRAPEDAQLLALAGESYIKTKNFNKATEYFEKASTLAPKTAPIHTALGISRLAQGEDQRAIVELETATNLDAKSPTAGIMLIMTHVRLKNFDKALGVAQILEKELPDNPLIPHLKGGIYLEKKDIPAARVSFEKALSIQPAYFPAAENLARLDLRDKKSDAARKRFEAVLDKDKKNIQAMTALAELALNQGKKQEATTWLERSVKENPDEARPSILLAAHHLRLDEKQKALSIAQNLQALHPAKREVLELLAQVQLVMNNQADALETCKKLAALIPESGEPHLRMAAIYMTMQNEAAASEALKKALSLQPDYLDAQLAQAALHLRNKRYEQTLKIARQIQKQHDKSPVGYLLEGDVLNVQNQPAFAVKAFEQAYALSKTGPIFIKMHETLKKTGKDKEADAKLSQWIKDNPADVSVRMQIGIANLMSQQIKEAIGHLQAVVEADPKNVVALNNLAFAYYQERDARALKYAEKAYEISPKNAAVSDTLGLILIDNNDLTRGLPLLQQAVSLAPESSDIRYHLVLGLLKSGNKAKARKELEQLLASGQKFSKLEEAQRLLKTL